MALGGAAQPSRRRAFSLYFTDQTSRYYYRPNLNLIVSLMPEIIRPDGSLPRRVITPMAGPGYVPVLLLAFYRSTDLRVVVWEDSPIWRRHAEENLSRNWFCAGRYEILHDDDWDWGDGAYIASAPERATRATRWLERLQDSLKALFRVLEPGSRVIVVSRRVDGESVWEGMNWCLYNASCGRPYRIVEYCAPDGEEDGYMIVELDRGST